MGTCSIGLPVLALSKDPDVNLFIRSALICILCLSTQLLIFVHKYQYQRKRGREEATSSRKSIYKERVISNKSRHALAEENERLRREVDALGNQVGDLRRRLNENDDEDTNKRVVILEDARTSITADVVEKNYEA